MEKGMVIRVLCDLQLLSHGLIFSPFSSEICLLLGQLVQPRMFWGWGQECGHREQFEIYKSYIHHGATVLLKLWP